MVTLEARTLEEMTECVRRLQQMMEAFPILRPVVKELFQLPSAKIPVLAEQGSESPRPAASAKRAPLSAAERKRRSLVMKKKWRQVKAAGGKRL